ncbi:MAG TPA: C39 family peptidase [Ktedonobacteraceae bacterium]
MPLLLLMLLAVISLIIILVGFILSNNQTEQVPRQRTVYRTPYYVDRSGHRLREPLRASRVQVVEYTEQRSLIDIWQSLAVHRIFNRRIGEPTPWMGITLILLSVFLLCIFLLKTILPSTSLVGAILWTNSSTSTTSSQSTSQQKSPAVQYPYIGASRALVRLSQLDPGQYDSSSEFDTWAYSACSAAAMTEVINSYGHNYRVTDILKVESQIGEITPQLGLLEEIGVQRTAARFNFQTAWGHGLSLDKVIDIANHGHPVIVSFPPDRYAGGHLLVVIGGNSDYVYLADSSSYNRRSLSRAQFLNWWEGFSAILSPN